MSEPTIQANIIANVNSDNLDDMKNLLSVLDQIGNNNTALPLGEPTQDISTDIPGTGSENLPVEPSDLTPEQDNALDDINNSMNLDESRELNESDDEVEPQRKVDEVIQWYDTSNNLLDLVEDMFASWFDGMRVEDYVQTQYDSIHDLDENINDPELCEFPGNEAIQTAGVISVAKDRPSIRDEDADTIYNESVEQFRASFNTFLESYGLNEAKSIEVKNKISNDAETKCTLDKSKVKSLLNQRSLPKDVKDMIMTKVEKKIEKDDGIDWDDIRKIMKNSGASQEAIDKAESKCKNK